MGSQTIWVSPLVLSLQAVCVSQGALYSLSLSAHLQSREDELGPLLDEEGLSTVGGRHCHQCVRNAAYRPVGCSKYRAQCSVIKIIGPGNWLVTTGHAWALQL